MREILNSKYLWKIFKNERLTNVKKLSSIALINVIIQEKPRATLEHSSTAHLQ